MKSGRYFFILFLILLTMPAYAQKGVDITGTVIEEGTNEPIEQATVRLLSVKDSSMIGGVATSRNGSFMLKNIKNGSYLLHVSFVGFDPLYQPLRVTGKTNPVKLGKLALTDGAIQLGEAVVIGKAPEVTVRNDTMEYNADSYKTTEGSMLEDLLKKMPGVEVEQRREDHGQRERDQKGADRRKRVLLRRPESGLQEPAVENDRQSTGVGQAERYGQDDRLR